MNKSMSFFEFKERFPDEDACFDYMVKVRWPNGFVCPRCSHQHAYPIRKRKLFQCADCRHQVSVTAGTVFHKLRQPLQKLFWAMYWVAAQKKGLSALELQRKLGLGSYQTAWSLLQKLRAAMLSSGKYPLTGIVEVDETYLDGSRHGNPGRGADNKALIAVAVERKDRNMGRAYLQPVQRATREELGLFVRGKIMPKSTLKTDGLASYKHLQGDYVHDPKSLKEPEDSVRFLPKVHIVITNLKCWLLGTYNRYPAENHLKRYLNEFEFRFNRRWNHKKIFDKLLTRCVESTYITYAELTG